MKTQISVKFNLESLQPLNPDLIDEAVQEKLLPQSDNWLERTETQALFDFNSLEISVNPLNAS